MKILVACEESQRVTEAFRNKGHLAFSCDILETSGSHPEWHIQGDVLPLINGYCTFTTSDGVPHSINQKWDMIIAFPPCTHLAASGAASYAEKRADGRQKAAIEFFASFLMADCDKVIIENPVGIINGKYVKTWFPELCKKYNLPKKPSQYIEPWQFGENTTKKTGLWIKGVPLLKPKVTEKPDIESFKWYDSKKKCCRTDPLWHYNTLSLPPEVRAKERSKTFLSIANAMAEQWG